MNLVQFCKDNPGTAAERADQILANYEAGELMSPREGTGPLVGEAKAVAAELRRRKRLRVVLKPSLNAPAFERPPVYKLRDITT